MNMKVMDFLASPEGQIVDQKLRWRRVYSGLERAIMAYQSRKGG